MQSSSSYSGSIVTATYTQQFGIHTLTATAGAHGAISPNGKIILKQGDSQTFTITANSGYEIAEVLIDGVNDPAAVAAGAYIFQNVTADHTIYVTFVENAGIDDVETDNHPSLRIYPNPTTGELTICDVRCATCDIAIFDVMGRTVHVETLRATSLQSEIAHRTSHIEMDISHLPTGIYFIRIQTDNGVVVRKVVKS